MNLLIHQGALGDWVLVFPLLRALCTAGGAAGGAASQAAGRTLAVSSTSKARLAARLIPGVEAVGIERPGFAALHGPWDSAAVPGGDAVASILGSVDGLILSFVSSGDDAWARNVRRLAPRAQLGCVDPRPPVDWNGHAADWQLHQLRVQGVTLAPMGPGGRVSPADGVIVVHPGSGGAEKCWPAERFEALVATLRASGRRVEVVLGEVEAERWPSDRVRRWREQLGARVAANLDELCDVLAPASLFIGNDSGPTHLAAQMGVLTVALFGPSDPVRWSPRGPCVRVIAPEGAAAMEWLSVERVLEAVEEEV